LEHQDKVVAVAFSLDGKTVLTGSTDKTARLWDTSTTRPLGPPLPHQIFVNAVAFSPDGKSVLTASGAQLGKGEGRLWETATGKPIGLPLPHQSGVGTVAVSPDGKTVLTGSYDKTARLWNVPRTVEGDPERVLLWVQVLTGIELDENGRTRVLDANTWQQRRQQLEKLGGPPPDRLRRGRTRHDEMD
jgi:WD40 repeat protein